MYLRVMGYPVEFFFPYRSSISSEPRLFLELCVFAYRHTKLLRRGVTQNPYSSLLATKWLFERLGNRQASHAQAPQKGRANTAR